MFNKAHFPLHGGRHSYANNDPRPHSGSPCDQQRRAIPSSDKHYPSEGTNLHHRVTSMHDEFYDSSTEDLYEEEESYYGACEVPEQLDTGYFSDQSGEYDGDDENENYYLDPCCTPRRLTRRQQHHLMTQNSRSLDYSQGNVDYYDPDNIYLNQPYEVERTEPTGFADRIKSRVCEYIENPTLFLHLGYKVFHLHCNVIVHAVMGAMLTTTILGAGMTLGFSAPAIGTVALPAMICGIVGGGLLGAYNDLVLNKPILPTDFHWLDGLTRTLYMPKYTFPIA